jgi:hypothetical protein
VAAAAAVAVVVVVVVEFRCTWNVKAKVIPEIIIRNHLKINQKTPAQHIGTEGS